MQESKNNDFSMKLIIAKPSYSNSLKVMTRVPVIIREMENNNHCFNIVQSKRTRKKWFFFEANNSKTVFPDLYYKNRYILKLIMGRFSQACQSRSNKIQKQNQLPIILLRLHYNNIFYYYY